jgi:hypothetical protein
VRVIVEHETSVRLPNEARYYGVLEKTNPVLEKPLAMTNVMKPFRLWFFFSFGTILDILLTWWAP